MTNCAIELLHQTHRQEVLRMIAEAFANDDPLARSQGMGESEFHDFIDRLYDDFANDRLSYVAIDTDANRAASVVLAEVHHSGPSDEGNDAIAGLFDAVREPYFADYTPAIGELMHINFIASNPDYRRQQLVQKLIASCLDEARDRGFQKAMVEASGIRSRTLLEKYFDFHPRVTIDYADFQWQDELPFSSIADHGGLTLMDRKL